MSARILIIEDNPANMELMAYLLDVFGHTVVGAVDGTTGLQKARGEQWDLVVCDVQLPDMEGYDVAATLKAAPATRGMPVVAVTALAMSGDREKVIAAGFDGYLSKPIDAERFVAQIESFLPMLTQSKEPERAGVNPAADVSSNDGATILVVDDHVLNLSLKRSLLEPFGYIVLTAPGMVSGLAVAQERKPDLILSDLGMSDGSGFDFIKKVKADRSLAQIPFIFITSTYCDEGARQRGLSLGAERVLFRPIDPHLILQEIRDCLKKRERGAEWLISS